MGAGERCEIRSDWHDVAGACRGISRRADTRQMGIARRRGARAAYHGGYRESVARATPSVVNIYTAKLVDTRDDPRLNSLFSAFQGQPRGRSASSGLWALALF